MSDEPNLFATRDPKIEIAAKHALTAISEVDRFEFDPRVTHAERLRLGLVDDLVRLEEFFQAFIYLAVIADGLGHVLAEIEHALLEPDHDHDNHNERANTDLTYRYQPHPEREHREDESRKQDAVSHKHPFGPPPFTHVRPPLLAYMLANVPFFVLDRTRVLHGIDIRGAVNHLSFEN